MSPRPRSARRLPRPRAPRPVPALPASAQYEGVGWFAPVFSRRTVREVPSTRPLLSSACTFTTGPALLIVFAVSKPPRLTLFTTTLSLWLEEPAQIRHAATWVAPFQLA